MGSETFRFIELTYQFDESLNKATAIKVTERCAQYR